MKFCPECGQKLDNPAFCPFCGTAHVVPPTFKVSPTAAQQPSTDRIADTSWSQVRVFLLRVALGLVVGLYILAAISAISEEVSRALR